MKANELRSGEIVLAAIAQSDGLHKKRPVLILRAMPPFGDYLVCGISTKVGHHAPGFDELVIPGDTDFSSSGLLLPSLIRLGWLASLPSVAIEGAIGSVSTARTRRLLERLSDHLIQLSP